MLNRIPEFAAALDALVAAAVAETAEKVATDAKARVAVRNGDLKEAIHTEATDEGVLVVAGGRTSNDRDVFYGHMVEHGTTHSGAEPFLVPALEQNLPVLTAALDEAIKKAAA
jgi:HK97 gp10 family phage protein